MRSVDQQEAMMPNRVAIKSCNENTQTLGLETKDATKVGRYQTHATCSVYLSGGWLFVLYL